ncbi:MAG: ATP-dependent Clp protease ATP-binding subunit [Ruminococcaceae bacterium]|nr:ATP-dependent Clp protease ATP-binding subunit [Oscillospiraceae bacterium]
MDLKRCSRCNIRPAIIFVQKNEGGKITSEGYCIKCAREMGIKPIDDILNQMNISPEELDAISEGMNGLMPMDGEEGEDDEGRAPSIDINAFFGGNKPAEAEDNNQNGDAKQGSPKQKGKRGASYLRDFCICLTERARENKLDNIVGRDSELERVIQILTRRQKNNPCLIGEPGVGKTAVAEALAQKIAAGDVPYKLKGKEVYLVDMTAVVAGTQFRGQFENRMRGLIEETKKAGNVILVIDEVHAIVGAGNAEGGMNAANILKPALSRGEIQLIGATTLKEYRQYIEKDAALERRFQPVMIGEPSIEDSIKILAGIKKYYEKHHGITIPDYLLRRMVVLSERYITDRFLPDKAIDLMDEACSHMAMHSPIINEIALVSDELKKLRDELGALEAKAEPEEGYYRRIADLKTAILQKEEKFNELSLERDKLELNDDEIARVIEVWTGVPATNISENEFVKIRRLEEAVKERIIGQDKAVETVARAIKRSRAGISYKKKPVSFIFAGSTGVGKTELVKVLARYLFDSPEALIRLDMSEFMEKHSVSRIIGSPPGYVGYDEAGQLTEKIRRKPYTVVLFDEIEKAHPDVMNILLQILDDGRITDAHGKEVNFENTVIIMTTNAGSSEGNSVAGFGESVQQNEQSRVMKALEGFLRPEFINRVDEIVVFNRLNTENFKAITKIMLGDLVSVLEEKGISFEYGEKLVDYLAEKGYSEKYGARNLRRLIQTEVEDKLAEVIVNSYRDSVSKLYADVKDEGVVVSTEK